MSMFIIMVFIGGYQITLGCLDFDQLGENRQTARHADKLIKR